MNERELRGLTIAALSKPLQKGGVWLVPSQSGKGRYTVCPNPNSPHCTCPDHETRGVKCKHIFAVEYVIRRERNADGKLPSLKPDGTGDGPKDLSAELEAYNAAQTHEKERFLDLLRDLCSGISEPGRQRTAVRVCLFRMRSLPLASRSTAPSPAAGS